MNGTVFTDLNELKVCKEGPEFKYGPAGRLS